MAVMGDSAKAVGLRMTRELRNKGFSVEMDGLSRNIKGQLKYADRLNARYTAVIGDNELAEGKVSLKDMASGNQIQVALEDIAVTIK